MSYQSKNLIKLKSFTAYCEEHPEERFWQFAFYLSNWYTGRHEIEMQMV